MRVLIAGFFGHNNCGDEGILQAIIDEIGWENEFIVQTSLPYTHVDDYSRKLAHVLEVRPMTDTRTDYDIFLLGGGLVNWGFAWEQIFRVVWANIPIMAYGVSFNTEGISEELCQIYGQFLRLLDGITVRDLASERLLDEMGIGNSFATCPAYGLKEEKFDCPENMIAVCPRYADFDADGKSHNEDQVRWILDQVKDNKDEVLLIPFNPTDKEHKARDLELCGIINKKLGGGVKTIFVDPYNPRRVKYAISKSRYVISGGRYHALVWASAHKIPYRVYPNLSGVVKSKIDNFIFADERIDMSAWIHRSQLIFKDIVQHG